MLMSPQHPLLERNNEVKEELSENQNGRNHVPSSCVVPSRRCRSQLDHEAIQNWPSANQEDMMAFSRICPTFYLLLVIAPTVLLFPLQLAGAQSANAASVEEHHDNIRRRTNNGDIQEYYEYMSHFDEGNATDNSIIGGSDTITYPWFVQFASKTCGGTLISRNRVLTSATCLLFTGIPSLVRVGATTARNGVLAQVACAKTHPDYYYGQGTILNDVAILKLVTDVDSVTPVILNHDTTYPSNGQQTLTALGMGYRNLNGGLSNRLQQVSLDFITTGECQSRYQSDFIIQGQHHLCAEERNRGICTGDSGGPLLDRPCSNAVQIGVGQRVHAQ